MKNEMLLFAKEIIRGQASPAKIMGIFGGALVSLWALGLVLGLSFAGLGIADSIASMIIVVPIMGPLLFLAYATPFLVLWNIRNAGSAVKIILLLLGCFFWVFIVGGLTLLIASGVTV